MKPSQQHKYEVWASNLLYLTSAISIVTDYVLKDGCFAPHKSLWQYLLLYGANLFLLFVYYKIRQGLKGAKTFFLVCYAFVVFHILSDGISPSTYDTELKAFSLAAQHTSQILACLFILLSLRSANNQPAIEATPQPTAR